MKKTEVPNPEEVIKKSKAAFEFANILTAAKEYYVAKAERARTISKSIELEQQWIKQSSYRTQ